MLLSCWFYLCPFADFTLVLIQTSFGIHEFEFGFLPFLNTVSGSHFFQLLELLFFRLKFLEECSKLFFRLNVLLRLINKLLLLRKCLLVSLSGSRVSRAGLKLAKLLSLHLLSEGSTRVRPDICAVKCSPSVRNSQSFVLQAGFTAVECDPTSAAAVSSLLMSAIFIGDLLLGTPYLG